MSTVAECRARAAEAEMIARRMSRSDQKEAALQIARSWSRRADELERNCSAGVSAHHPGRR